MIIELMIARAISGATPKGDEIKDWTFVRNGSAPQSKVLDLSGTTTGSNGYSIMLGCSGGCEEYKPPKPTHSYWSRKINTQKDFPLTIPCGDIVSLDD